MKVTLKRNLHAVMLETLLISQLMKPSQSHRPSLLSFYKLLRLGSTEKFIHQNDVLSLISKVAQQTLIELPPFASIMELLYSCMLWLALFSMHQWSKQINIHSKPISWSITAHFLFKETYSMHMEYNDQQCVL